MALSSNHKIEPPSQSVGDFADRRHDSSFISSEDAVGDDIKKTASALFYHTSTALMVLDQSFCIVLVNNAVCKMLGYERQELLGQKGARFFDEDNWQNLSEEIDTEIRIGKRTNRRLSISCECIHKNGNAISGLLVVNMIVDIMGLEHCFLMEIHDNRELRRVQREAEERRLYYQAISDNAFDAVLVFQDGICIDANATASEMFGIPLEALIGMPGADLAVPENRKLAEERISSGDESPYHAVAMKRDGTRFHVMVQIKIVNLGGRKVRMTMLRDVDREVRAERALRESERHLRSFMEAATDFVLFRLRKNPEKPFEPDIIFVSPSIRDFFDSTFEPSIQELIEMVHPEDVENLIEIATALLEGQRVDRRVRVRNTEAFGWRWARVVFTVLKDEDEERLFINGIVFDETGEVEAVEALKSRERELRRQTETLREVNTALEVLLRKREVDRAEVEEKMLRNAKTLILPYLEKLKSSRMSKRQKIYIDLIESSINAFISPLSQRMSRHYMSFTPLEIQVANLVKEGKTTKDIAEIIGLSFRTIESVRYTVRRKLGITEKRASLRNYLLAIDDEGEDPLRN